MGKSTGKLDLLAEWADPVDNPSDPANDPTSDETRKQMYVKEILLEDGTSDTVSIGGPQIEAIKHELGDTKRHIVTYQAPGTTRYREYMDPAVLATPEELMRPTPAEVGSQAALDAMIEVGHRKLRPPRGGKPGARAADLPVGAKLLAVILSRTPGKAAGCGCTWSGHGSLPA